MFLYIVYTICVYVDICKSSFCLTRHVFQVLNSVYYDLFVCLDNPCIHSASYDTKSNMFIAINNTYEKHEMHKQYI